jgi:hypothetical protein
MNDPESMATLRQLRMGLKQVFLDTIEIQMKIFL